jgi:hypothetical protein
MSLLEAIGVAAKLLLKCMLVVWPGYLLALALFSRLKGIETGPLSGLVVFWAFGVPVVLGVSVGYCFAIAISIVMIRPLAGRIAAILLCVVLAAFCLLKWGGAFWGAVPEVGIAQWVQY